MVPRASLAAVLACSALIARSQTADPNLQNLLGALTNGTEVTMVTPLTSGMLQVTSFNPGNGMSGIDAMAAVNRARSQLQALGEPQPTAEEIARMLAGGPIDLPGGRIQALGILPASGQAAAIRSQVVAGGTPLPPGASYTSGASPSPRRTPPPSAPALAPPQLARLGILQSAGSPNPTA